MSGQGLKRHGIPGIVLIDRGKGRCKGASAAAFSHRSEMEGIAEPSFTARIGRAQLHPARPASKKYGPAAPFSS